MNKLFQPYDLAGLQLCNRVVMAPMTRSRNPDLIPDEQTALYYSQRASAGLIVSEGIPVSQEGSGFLFNPSLYTAAQAKGWAKVTEAVHARGGRIFAQLWHVGRLSHVSLQAGGVAPIGPVSRAAETSSAFAWAVFTSTRGYTSLGLEGQTPAQRADGPSACPGDSSHERGSRRRQ